MSKVLHQKGIKWILPSIGLVAFLVLLMADTVSGYTFLTNNHGNHGENSENRKSGLELTVNSEAIYNGVPQPDMTWEAKNLVPTADRFFNFQDVKPGDMGRHLISLHVKKSDAYVCLDFNNLEDHENGTNEPERLVDTTTGGDLSRNLEFFAWRDDGDNEFEVGEMVIFGTSTHSGDVLLSDTTYAVADSHTGNSCRANSVNYVGIVWCAGDLKVDLDTAEVSCSPDMGNDTQTDSMTVDLVLRAVQAKYNEGFVCEKEWSPQDPHDHNHDHHGENDHGHAHHEHDEHDNDSNHFGHDDENHPDHVDNHDHAHNADNDEWPIKSNYSEEFSLVEEQENSIMSFVRQRLLGIFSRFGWVNNT